MFKHGICRLWSQSVPKQISGTSTWNLTGWIRCSCSAGGRSNFSHGSIDNNIRSLFPIKGINRQITTYPTLNIVEKQSDPIKELVADNKSKVDSDEAKTKPSIFARFKQMYKQYWYILVPVHLVTSAGWLVGFYYMSKSGVDIAAVLQSLKVGESVIDKVKDSSMGHLAMSYVCYKIMTPIRYMVTVGGTTVSIKYLSQWGYIRPMPSTAQMRKMYDNQKAKFK